MNNQILALQQTFHRIVEGDESIDLSDILAAQDLTPIRQPNQVTSLYQSIKIHRSQIYPDEEVDDFCEEEEKDDEKEDKMLSSPHSAYEN